MGTRTAFSFTLLYLALALTSCGPKMSASADGAGAPPVAGGPRISAQAAQMKIAQGAVVVDVRRPDEYSAGHLPGAINIPHEQVAQRYTELERFKSDEIVLYCASGRRAGLALDELRARGFDKLYNGGGFDALAAAAPD